MHSSEREPFMERLCILYHYVVLILSVIVSLLITGATWQKTLYHAIDRSRCFIALQSQGYKDSVVCNEEFNLALAKYHAKVV